ncbi:MAG: complex I NDUFA9 subunit family protein [Stellaceae bacterium]
MPERVVTVFGGTGFLGRCIVRHLREAGFAVRVAARRPPRGGTGGTTPGIAFLRADVSDGASVAAALNGAWAAVNAVSLYVERGVHTFRSIHVEAAERVAATVARAGVKRLAHLSGIGANAHSSSPYIRSRGEGEAAVRQAFPSAILIRPAVMFGPGDALVTPLSNMLRHMPAFPLFGRGETRLQPVYVEDVAAGIVCALQAPAPEPVQEFAGPHIYSYAELLRAIAAGIGGKPVLFPVPFALWRALAFAAEFSPAPPVTRNQIELMRIDNIAAPDVPGFAALGITPRSLEEILPQMAGKS